MQGITQRFLHYGRNDGKRKVTLEGRKERKRANMRLTDRREYAMFYPVVVATASFRPTWRNLFRFYTRQYERRRG